MEIVKDEACNVGNPNISELISILTEVKEEFGDLPVASSYDGNWHMPVEVMVLSDRVIVGTLS